MITALFKPEEAVSFDTSATVSVGEVSGAGTITLSAGDGRFTTADTSSVTPLTGGLTPAYWPPISPPPPTTTTVPAKTADLTPAAPIKDTAGIKDIAPIPAAAPVAAVVPAKSFDWKTAMIIAAVLVALFIGYKFIFKKGK